MDVEPKPPVRSAVVDAHFDLDYALIGDADIPMETIPRATESPEQREESGEEERNAWNLNWVAGLRNSSPDHVPTMQDTNNLWNHFRPGAMEGLRKTLGRIAQERREHKERYGEDEGFRPRRELAYFEAQLYAWIVSGTFEKAIERFGGDKMETLLDDMALLEVLWKGNRASELPGSAELLAAAKREAATLLNQLALVLYDLGVPVSAIHG